MVGGIGAAVAAVQILLQRRGEEAAEQERERGGLSGVGPWEWYIPSVEMVDFGV